MNTFEKIKWLCSRHKISLNKLEKECGLSKQSVEKWTNSVPRSDSLAKVANYFNVSVDWLLGLTDEPNKKKVHPKRGGLRNF